MTHPGRLLRAAGLRPRRALGQNFLVDPRALSRIAAALDAGPEDLILEIGAGTGALTREIAGSGAGVVAVELDPALADLARRELVDLPRVRVETGDILKTDLEALARAAGRPLLVAGNLPYYLATEILFHLVAHPAAVARAVLMVQKEVADRIRARPGGREYGILSVLVQYRCEVARVMNVPPAAFYPPPQVESTLLSLVPRRTPEPRAQDEALFTRLVRAAFGGRRKTLRNALAREAGCAAEAAARLRAAGIEPMRRPETLAVGDWVCLANRWEA